MTCSGNLDMLVQLTGEKDVISRATPAVVTVAVADVSGGRQYIAMGAELNVID